MCPRSRMKSFSLLVMATLLLCTHTHGQEDVVAKEPEICAGDPWPQIVLTPQATNQESDEFHRVLLRFKEDQDPVLKAIAEDDTNGKSPNIKEREKWVNCKAVDGWLPQGVLSPILEPLSQFDTAVRLTLRWHYGAHTRILILDLESEHHMMKVSESLQQEGALYFVMNDDQTSSASSQGSSNKVPNDPLISRQWALLSTNAIGQEGQSGAWDYTQGDKGIVVAVIDTGVDYNHPDLKDSMWVNEGEIPFDGIDNDNNGYVDDVYGMNAVEGANNDTAGDPMDDNMHGTHCAGIIAAQADNGEGIAGIAPGVSIMAVKALGASGTLSALVMAFEYVLMMKADVISLSLGAAGDFGDFFDILLGAAEEQGVVAVAASGNDRSDNDATPNWPANGDQSTTITVGSINAMGCIDGMSNYGVTTVDLMAPGAVIMSTMPLSTDMSMPYNFASGTSMACPYVSGAAALVLSYWKETGQEFKGRGAEVKKLLMEGVRKDARFKGFVVTGGALDAAKTLELAEAQSKPKEKTQGSKTTDRMQMRQDKPVRDSANAPSPKDSRAPSRDAPHRDTHTRVYSRRSADMASRTRDHSRFNQDRPHPTNNDQSRFNSADRPHPTNNDQSRFNSADHPHSTNNDQSRFNRADYPHSNNNDQSRFNRADRPHSTNNDQSRFNHADRPQSTNNDQSRFNNADYPHSTNNDQSRFNRADRPHSTNNDQSRFNRADHPHTTTRMDETSSFPLEWNKDERVYTQRRFAPCGPVECCQDYDASGSPLYCFSHKDGSSRCNTMYGCDESYGWDCRVPASGQCLA